MHLASFIKNPPTAPFEISCPQTDKRQTVYGFWGFCCWIEWSKVAYLRPFDPATVSVANESVPIQLAQCWFPGLAISNAKIEIYFSEIKYTEAI